LPVSQSVQLAVYNTQGQLIEMLVNDYKPAAGRYAAIWTPDSQVPTGVYLAILSVGGNRQIQKLSYIR
jgi:hypothetical protein